MTLEILGYLEPVEYLQMILAQGMESYSGINIFHYSEKFVMEKLYDFFSLLEKFSQISMNIKKMQQSGSPILENSQKFYWNKEYLWNSFEGFFGKKYIPALFLQRRGHLLHLNGRLGSCKIMWVFKVISDLKVILHSLHRC